VTRHAVAGHAAAERHQADYPETYPDASMGTFRDNGKHDRGHADDKVGQAMNPAHVSR
jgi:hypothetical protein